MSARTRFCHCPRAVPLAAACLLLAGTALAASPGRCVTAAVPWPFVLPDGSVHPAGTLTLCLSRVHDPVTGLHELRVGRHPIGLYLSRLGRGEGEPHPVVVFAPSARGSYRLVGYALPLGDTLETFRFYDARTKQARLLARAPLLAPDTPPDTVLLAAAPGERR
jgi:hypothetical protein